MRLPALATLPLLLLACTRGSEPTVTPDPVAKATSTASTTSPPAPLPADLGPPLVTTLQGHVGEVVRIDVIKAKQISQHMMPMIPGKTDEYFSPVGSDVDFVGSVKTTPTCTGTMRLTGKVTRISGPGKGPKPDTYSEVQLDIDSVECR